jgi:hypothetical protein
MMERRMTQAEKPMARNKVMKRGLIAATLLSAILITARLAGVLPVAQNMSPPGVIAFCIIITAVVVGYVVWYLTHTDEHDLNANLWSMAWAWVGSALLTVNWGILHVGKLAPAPNALIIFLGSAALAATTWVWLRFR